MASNSPARSQAAFFDRPRCLRRTSANWVPSRSTGLRAFIALWKTMATFSQRRAASWRSVRRRMSVLSAPSWPCRITEPAVVTAGGRSRRVMAVTRVDFPQPLSPPVPGGAAQREVDAADGVHGVVLVEVVDVQIADGEQRGAGGRAHEVASFTGVAWAGTAVLAAPGRGGAGRRGHTSGGGQG